MHIWPEFANTAIAAIETERSVDHDLLSGRGLAHVGNSASNVSVVPCADMPDGSKPMGGTVEGAGFRKGLIFDGAARAHDAMLASEDKSGDESEGTT